MTDASRGESFPGRARAALALVVLAVMVVWLTLPVAPASAAKQLSGTFTISQGSGFTTSPSVTLDSRIRGAKLMRFKNADGSYSAWETYASSKVWVLGPGDGLKSVEAQYKGATGSRAVLFDDITLDTTGPVTSSDYDGVPRRIVQVTLSPVDALSIVAGTWYRLDGGVWREGVSTTLRACPKRNGLESGPHTLEFYSTDVLGNVGPIASSAVTLQY